MAAEGAIGAQTYTVNAIKKYKDIARFKVISLLASNKEALLTLVKTQKNKKAGVEAASDRVDAATSSALARLGALDNAGRVTRQIQNQFTQIAVRSTLDDAERRKNSAQQRAARSPQIGTIAPVGQPSSASGIGQVDVFGSTLPIGARGSTNAGRSNLRQMATNNPEVARALGIRGATAGLL